MCIHTYLDAGYCMSCGLQIHSSENLVNQDFIQFFTLPKVTKYTVNQFIKQDTNLDKLIDFYSINIYKSEIQEELSTKKWISRLNKVDKCLLSIYKVLRIHHYPITFHDLSKFTTNVLKKWFKEYKFIPYDNQYLINILDRFNITGIQINIFNFFVSHMPTYQLEKIILGYTRVFNLSSGVLDSKEIISENNLIRLVNKMEKIYKSISIMK